MKYRVERELATAQQGSILLGRDAELDRAVVIKSVAATDGAAAEVQIHASLPPHPHVLRLTDHFDHDNTIHMVFDYCPNGDLYAELKRRSRFRMDQALAYMAQITSAVLHIHSQGIAHRDLSLENVLLDASSNCQLCDFGLAVPVSSCSADDGPVGKMKYMAPEVFAEEAYDPCKADVWSLGIMLFMMVSGVLLVEQPSGKDKRYRMLEAYGVHSLVNLWHLEAFFSESLLELLELMLEIDPVRRLSTKEVLHALLTELNNLYPTSKRPWLRGVLLNI
ncbi:unnamed protein product [Aphanomyces euteiches]